MKNQMMRCLLAMLLVLVLVVAFAACGKDPADTTAPDTTAPEVTEPEVTEPEVTEPEVTEPEVTEPEVTEPEVTEPEVTLPDETLPEETLPAETEPEVTEPEETTKPADTTAPAGPHKHEYQSVATYPTCDAPGVITYVCSCGDSYTKEGEPALGHAWKNIGGQDSTCTVAGYDRYECVSCGFKEDRARELLAHDFAVSTQLVSADADPLGVGYEILACSICDQHMKKVAATHVSGHTFVKTEGGFVCACGALAIDEARDLGVNNFEDKKEITAPNSFEIVDGKLLISGYNGQKSVQSTAMTAYVDLLTGVYKGQSVSNTFYSFDLIYNNPVPAEYGSSAGDKHFFTWRSGTANRNYEVSLFLYSDGEGKMIASGESGEVTLEMGESYTFTVAVVPETREISLTVKGNFMGEDGALAEAEIVLVEPKTMFGATFMAAFFSRDKFYYENAEEFALYLDNLAVSYSERLLNNENMVADLCEHAFESKQFVDLAHPLDQMWFRDTCTACGRFLERQDCELLGGHAWLSKPDESKTVPATCTATGLAYYDCARCDAVDERVLEMLPHAWDNGTVIEQNDCTKTGLLEYNCDDCEAFYQEELPAEHSFVVYGGTVAAKDDPYGEGYELWDCPGCEQMVKVEATHESGHSFDEKNECACGTILALDKTNVALHTFDAVKGTNMEFGGTSPVSLKDGKFHMSVSGGQPNVSASNNGKISELMRGVLTDEPVEQVLVSFDLSYESLRSFAVSNAVLLSFRTTKTGSTSQYEEINIFASVTDGEMTFGGKKLVAGETYTVLLVLIPGTNNYTVTLTGGAYDDELLTKGTLKYDLSAFNTMVYRSNAFQIAVEDGAIYVDNVSFDYATTQVDLGSAKTPACSAHAFNGEDSDSEDYPAADGYEKYTCTECGGFYYDLGCDALGHAWGEPDVTLGASCLEPSIELYTCRVCGETREETLSSSHVYSTFEGVVTAEADLSGDGYELWACACGEMKKIAANHSSGHFFDENDACACGAVAEAAVQKGILSHDFSSTSAAIGWSYGKLNEFVLEDGKWVMSKTNLQTMIEKANAPTFFQALQGNLGDRHFQQIEVSMKLTSTGVTSKNNEVLFSWRSTPIPPSTAYTTEAEIKLTKSGNAMALSGNKVSTYVLEDGAEYTVILRAILAEDKLVAIVKNAAGAETVIGEYAMKQPIKNLQTLVFRAKNIMPASGETYSLVADDLTIDGIGREANESAMATVACKHSFEESVVSTDLYKYTCSACGKFYTGAKELMLQKIEVEKLDFTDKSSIGVTELTIENLSEADLKGGMWDLAVRGKMSFIRPGNSSVSSDKTRNNTLAQLLKGTDADGNTVNAVELSFKLKYTGSMANLATESALINMLEDTNGNNVFQLFLVGRSDGKAVMYENASRSTTLVLEKDTFYTITVRMDPAVNRVTIVVTDEAGNRTTMADLAFSKAIFSPMRQITISRDAYKSTEFSLGFDEIVLSYDIIK